MKNLLIIITLFLVSSCAGPNGSHKVDASIINAKGKLVWGGKLYITHGTRKLEPNHYDDSLIMFSGVATFEGLKTGNYTISWDDDVAAYCASYVEKSSVQFRLKGDRSITLNEGQLVRE